MTDGPDTPEQFHVEGRHRTGDSGPLFGGGSEASMGESFGTNAGLVHGDRSDPVLVAGVGYPLLGDMALGTVVAYRVADWDLPGVAVADCSHTPVAAYQTFTETEYEAIVIVGAEKREGEVNDGQPSADPGAIHEYGPDRMTVPDDESVTELLGQTAMGLNTLENVVVVTRALGEFPERTRIISVEPAYDSWGMNVQEFTGPVEASLDEVLERVLTYLEETLDDLGVAVGGDAGNEGGGDTADDRPSS